MRVLSLVTQKGGTGKSALAVSLAVMAEQAGERVCILDLDPQGTSASWYETRTAETPAVLDHNQAGAVPETVARLRDAGFTLVIIDTPGIDSHATRGAMREADLCLIPVRPSEADVKATMPTVRALEGMGRPYALVINQAPTNKQARVTAAVSVRLSTQGMVLPVPIASRIDHQYAYALGQGVHEYDPNGKAAAEIAEVWAWCRKRMESGDGAPEKK
ncbi:ParA family protein [Methylobacterium indicum]|jgi:chromosome partitioning protein|uniref:Partition protein (ParA) n=1 Tax=Methylobacterium indicum TaxID=1775910 RepID=A0ABR5H680_9HYPH|nr:ParA family protein [Methylobacterium indicum]KMO19667.1 partition protein (ParA) [Methylobacterium indicum]KMO24402.1 partition protein (ParA) [Methylobacterium indicum]